jgi:hypothetical protein
MGHQELWQVQSSAVVRDGDGCHPQATWAALSRHWITRRQYRADLRHRRIVLWILPHREIVARSTGNVREAQYKRGRDTLFGNLNALLRERETPKSNATEVTGAPAAIVAGALSWLRGSGRTAVPGHVVGVVPGQLHHSDVVARMGGMNHPVAAHVNTFMVGVGAEEDEIAGA